MSVVTLFPFPGVSGPTGDVTAAVQSFETGTTTGPQAQSNSTLTGLTPKAAIFLGSYHNVALDPGEGFQCGHRVLRLGPALLRKRARRGSTSTGRLVGRGKFP